MEVKNNTNEILRFKPVEDKQYKENFVLLDANISGKFL